MIQALYTGATGMVAEQRSLDTIANNVANVNTVGFKKNRVDFKDAMYQTMINPVGQGEGNLLQGVGVTVASTAKYFFEGKPIESGNPLDLTIRGDGFFMVQTTDGDTFFTRNGSFYLGEQEDGLYVIDSSGNYLVDADGERITLDNAYRINVADDGTINYIDPESGELNYGQRIGVYTFPNQTGLEAVGNTTFIETENSGAPEVSETATLAQGYLESSNVDLADEMTRLIRTQRAYQMASRVIQTANEMEGIANNIRQ